MLPGFWMPARALAAVKMCWAVLGLIGWSPARAGKSQRVSDRCARSRSSSVSGRGDRMGDADHQPLASKYGQRVSVFGGDPETIGRLIDPLVNQVCRVNINSQRRPTTDVEGAAVGASTPSPAR